MMHFVYLFGLIIAITALSLIDRKLKLAFWLDARRTWQTLIPAIGIFIVWDVVNISAGVFYHGQSSFSLPITIFPEFPIEELFFLFLLCYSSLLLYTGVSRRWPHI